MCIVKQTYITYLFAQRHAKPGSAGRKLVYRYGILSRDLAARLETRVADGRGGWVSSTSHGPVV
jgi:hypothetical protein